MGLQRFPYSDFRGGVNLRSGPFDLEPNEARDALNMTLTYRGALFERAGKTQFDNGSVPANKHPEHLRAWYTAGGLQWLIASVDGSIYSVNTGGACVSRFAGTAGKTWCFEQAQDSTGADRLWAVNGTDTPQKWDGIAAGTSAWAGAPPNGTMIRLWKNRMVVAGISTTPQRLRYSDIGDPETFGANSFFDVKTTDDDKDPITWLEVVGDVLLVFKRRSVWEIFDGAFTSARRLGTPGCEDRFQSAEVDGRVHYLSRNGIYSVTPNQAPNEESSNIQPWFPANLNFQQISKARVLGTRDSRVLVAVPVGGSTVNNRLIEIDTWLRPVYARSKRPADSGYFGPPACMFHDLAVSSMCIFRPTFTDKIIAADSGANKLHSLFEGTTDDGVAINSFWLSGWQKFIAEEPFERIRRLNVEMSGSCHVDIYEDFSDSARFSAALQAPLDPDPFWNGGTWDSGIWDPLVPVRLNRVRPEARGRYHSIRLSNSDLGQTFNIYAMEFVIRGGKEH